jgi:Dyp-type peroxidase family
VVTRLSDEALADIQGFIISGYGHLPLVRYLFLEIHEATRAQAWLTALIPTVTSAAPWPVAPDGTKIKPPAAVNVAFTADGLRALRVPQRVQCTFPAEFLDGMASPDRSAILGDTEESAPSTWELGGPAGPAIHVALLVYGASNAELDRACAVQRALLDSTLGGVTEHVDAVQDGYRPDSGHEPFGFHDGIAQPSIGAVSRGGVPNGQFILGYPNHYDVVAPAPVVDDNVDGSALLPPLANPYHQAVRVRDLGLNGSFVVYRKLQQDVGGFWQFMKREAVRATGREDAAYMVWLASRCVGRWPSGTPLVTSPDQDDPRFSERNDFRYEDDVDGFKCPLGAHIRRANPRAVLPPYPVAESLSMSEAHGLLRRGRVFGPPLVDPRVFLDPAATANATTLVNLADDGVARGLHFFCVNASIKSQFEFVQQTWCNNPRFGGLDDNKDPIIGDNARTGQPSSRMSIARRPLGVRTAALPRFVTVKGGTYLFMPSMTALRFLAAVHWT